MDNVLLSKNIENELHYRDFVFNDADKHLVHKMLYEINALGYNFQYLAELDAYKVPGSGRIILKFIHQFISEATRAYLLPQLVLDRIENCDETLVQLYLHFKASEEYISKPGKPAPAHIYVRYDNGFSKLKSKKIEKNLLELARYPRDAFYLPFTMRMLAKWKAPEMLDLLMEYLDGSNITLQSLGMEETVDSVYYPPIQFIKRELVFTAIDGLTHYPSAIVYETIKSLLANSDKDIRLAATKAMRVLEKISPQAY